MHSPGKHTQSKQQDNMTPTELGKKIKLLRSHIASFRRKEKKKKRRTLLSCNHSIFEELWKAKGHCTLGGKEEVQSDTKRMLNCLIFCCPALKYVISSFLCYNAWHHVEGMGSEVRLAVFESCVDHLTELKTVEEVLASLRTPSPSIRMAKLRAQCSQSCL